MANKYTNRSLLDYNFNPNDDDNYKSAAEKASSADAKYNGIGDWKYGDEDAFTRAKDALTNRKAFSYDLNADALYQQYKDQYITQGKMASQDVMGQAAALTGGYASSYAATVGNQAYQGYLQGLNDKVPELYQLAMQRYNMEGDQLRTAYDVLNSDRESDYSKFMDNKNMAFNEMSHYNTLKDAAYTQAQTNYNNSVNVNNDNYWNEYNAGYQKERDDIADKQWQTTFDYNKTRDEQSQSNWQTEFDYGKERDKVSDNQWQQQFDWQKSQKATTTGKDIESGLPSGITDKVTSLGNDIERANYLEDQKNKGYITEEQKNYILAQTLVGDTVEYDGGRYYMVDNGGVNGFLGLGKWLGNIDDNAKVMDEDGNVYTMKQLYNKKINDDKMSAADAKKWVVDLQKKIGAN